MAFLRCLRAFLRLPPCCRGEAPPLQQLPSLWGWGHCQLLVEAVLLLLLRWLLLLHHHHPCLRHPCLLRQAPWVQRLRARHPYWLALAWRARLP